MEIKEQQTLWSMRGIRQNDQITWEAVPKFVKTIDEHMIRFYGGGGISKNGIGSIYFTSKEECEQYWVKNREFVEKIGFEDPTPEGVDERPRTNWENYEIVRFDGVDSATVYYNGLGNLVKASDRIRWHKDTEHVMEYGMEIEYLELHEISEQIKHGLITVIVNGPMRSKIFQWGNYKDGGWVFLGEVQGYA